MVIGSMEAFTTAGMAEKTDKWPLAERLRHARNSAGMSQAELAAAVGMAQSAIAAIEAGEVRRPQKIRELARILDRSEDWLFGGEPLHPPQRQLFDPPLPSSQPSNAGAPFATDVVEGRVPLLGQAAGGFEGKLIFGEKVGDAFRPPNLAHIVDAYAVFVHGTSMEERFRSGDTVWVNPSLPVRSGDDVVVQIRAEDRIQSPVGFVKRFLSWGSRELVLLQLNPPEGQDREMRFPTENVIAVHKIVFVAPG